MRSWNQPMCFLGVALGFLAMRATLTFEKSFGNIGYELSLSFIGFCVMFLCWGHIDREVDCLSVCRVLVNAIRCTDNLTVAYLTPKYVSRQRMRTVFVMRSVKSHSRLLSGSNSSTRLADSLNSVKMASTIKSTKIERSKRHASRSVKRFVQRLKALQKSQFRRRGHRKPLSIAVDMPKRTRASRLRLRSPLCRTPRLKSPSRVDRNPIVIPLEAFLQGPLRSNRFRSLTRLAR